MERVVVVMEFPNINRAANDRGQQIDYESLLNYLVVDRFLIEAFSYVPIDPRNVNARDREIETLRMGGWLVQTKIGRASETSYKCNFDVEITMELMHIAERIKPDTIILASGDIDFIPVVSEMRRRGIRLEVASFPEAVAKDLILHSSGYINLEHWLEANPTKSMNHEEQEIMD